MSIHSPGSFVWYNMKDIYILGIENDIKNELEDINNAIEDNTSRIDELVEKEVELIYAHAKHTRSDEVSKLVDKYEKRQ